MCTRNSTAVVRCALSLSEQDAAGLTSLGSRCFHNAIVRLPARVQINHTLIPLSTKGKKKAQFTLRHTSISKAPEGTKVKILEVYIFKFHLLNHLYITQSILSRIIGNCFQKLQYIWNPFLWINFRLIGNKCEYQMPSYELWKQQLLSKWRTIPPKLCFIHYAYIQFVSFFSSFCLSLIFEPHRDLSYPPHFCIKGGKGK